jgi:magnesium-transporting ATPase (P-type)
MSTVASDGSKKYMFVKGAPEKVLDKCTKYQALGSKPTELTPQFKLQLIN